MRGTAEALHARRAHPPPSRSRPSRPPTSVHAARIDPIRLTLVLLAVRDPKSHPLRTRILDELARHPGLHLREIARRLDVPPSQAQHHLRVLLKARFITETREEAYLRYWPTEAAPVGRVAALTPDEQRLLRFLRRPTPFRILVTLTVDGPRTLSAIADHLGIAPSTAHYHLGRLRKAGLVDQTHEAGSGRAWHATDPDLLRRLLLEHEPAPEAVEGFMDTWDRLSV